MKPTGSKFYKALCSEYAKVGDREAKEDDWTNAVEYADRAIKSSSGGPVYPEAIEARDLPKNTAHAQGKFFDCRMEEIAGWRSRKRTDSLRITPNAAPAAATADGQREAHNRRVEANLVQSAR